MPRTTRSSRPGNGYEEEPISEAMLAKQAQLDHILHRLNELLAQQTDESLPGRTIHARAMPLMRNALKMCADIIQSPPASSYEFRDYVTIFPPLIQAIIEAYDSIE